MVATHRPHDRIPQGWYPFAQSDESREARPFGIPHQSWLDQQALQMGLTLERWSWGNQIRKKPPTGMHNGVLPNPLPPLPDSLIPAMNHNLMDEITETMFIISNNSMKITNTKPRTASRPPKVTGYKGPTARILFH